MKRELEHFYIGASYGGNQDWFPTFMMRIGGCGAETACDSSIYFAMHRGIDGIAPEEPGSMTKEDYVDFAYRMRPYLSPRMSGIDRLDIYIDGYAQYLKDCGDTRISMTPLSGDVPWKQAREAVRRQIDEGYPIPTLILNHRNPRFKEYVWHWFLINGYDDRTEAGPGTDNDSSGEFLVRAVTYSSYEWLDLKGLWNTGCIRRGGLILYSDVSLYSDGSLDNEESLDSEGR